MREIVEKISRFYLNFLSLKSLYTTIEVVNSSYAKLCENNLNEHLNQLLLNFSVPDMLQWALNYRSLGQRAPTSAELLHCLRKKVVEGTQYETIELMNVTEAEYPECSVELIEILKSTLCAYIQTKDLLNLFVFCVDIADIALMVKHFDVVEGVLRSIPASGTLAESRSLLINFFTNKLRKIGTIKMTSNHEAIMKHVVEYCVRPLKPQDNVTSYFDVLTANNRNLSTFTQFFFDNWMQSCTKQFRISTIMGDLDELLRYVELTSNLDSCGLYCVLQMLGL